MRALFLTALIAVALWTGLDDWRHRSIHPAPGVLVPDIPEQRDLASAASFVQGNYTLTPRANFRITARILGTERYRLNRTSDLIPWDFALGWGVMSDSAIIDRLKISQSDRFYFWGWSEGAPPAPIEVISASSANMHLIPASASVKKVLDAARVGQIITLEGRLVDALDKNGWTYKTSLTRSDTGAGACEIIFVEDARIQ